MKKSLAVASAMLMMTAAHARTTLYGEVAATAQAQFNEAGSLMTIDGAGSEFGFVGEHDLTNSEQVDFDLKVGFDLLTPSLVALVEGQINLSGNFGSVGFYNGASPASESTQLLNLMNNDPDSNRLPLGASHGVDVPVGVQNSTGIRYASPELEGGISFSGAVVASGNVNSSSGVSMAGAYRTNRLNVSVGFELNVEQENSQLFRLAAELPAGNASIGGILQLASNADLDASIRSTVAYAKFPLVWANFSTRNQVLVSLTASKDSADETRSDAYVSFVQEIPWSNKVSSFAFVDSLLANDLNDATTWVGGGLRIKF